MLAHPTGVYRLLSSVAATTPLPSLSTPSPIRPQSWITALRSMAPSLRRRRDRFTATLPSLTLAPMSKRAHRILDARHRHALCPFGGGPLSADDHAQAALFLCSDESKHITGQLIRVDGGWGVN